VAPLRSGKKSDHTFGRFGLQAADAGIQDEELHMLLQQFDPAGKKPN
jgi:hypothetical protein